ncbi:UbiA family prenyltransferase [Aspergillus clavatus NRRL 1]|uniref:UbiA prenyltransferase family protein n=1 Tax=Aspergillus clavatus (strain ATCC 1007 / CBS 513.65 / DSM 816 / NCTC 3887 / NRRL 1 / QM 1276 / 107) TaxID=344612 RepID=A1C4K7_ASPCL|nr:uncharacterized protein ACLA_060140 [Aspergillus clavatus NRRL 1]EAW15347.1 conserved hypothetical protein [Aspergillus clavatus NRRL 1]
MSDDTWPSLAQLPALIWHFTESNFATFVLPNSGFGLLAALAAPVLTDCLHRPTAASLLLQGLPQMILFNWANIFVFDLANQRLPQSQEEDRINKPWRPLPRKRITQDATRRLMLIAIPTVWTISSLLGVGREGALILLLTWLYNDLQGGDELVRDLIIAAAYGLYLSSSLRIAVGATTHQLSDRGYQWIGLIGAVILTTMQVQDLKDQAGDRSRGRKTWPLVLGERLSRRLIAGFVLFWSVIGAWFWQLSWGPSLVPMTMGLWVGLRVLQGRNDAWAWKWWCVWQVVLYSLPWLSGEMK